MLHLNIIKVKTPEEMGKAAADEFEAVICRKPACVMGLATGSTPLPLYRELVAREQAGKLDFSRVRSANLDEYKGLAPDHPQSYRRFMQENLFDHISIKLENTIVPDGLAADIPAMCEAYERRIEDWGGVDIQLLGLGHDGHIGFNEPCDHFPVMTYEVKLTEMTREANKRFFSSIDEVPTAAITMGIGTVMAARKIVMVITGADKADILYKVFFGPVMPEVPGSILQFHSDVTLICDNMASMVMKNGWVQACFVGCDRIAANGDFANKIGTSGVAILAKHYGIPVYTLGPTSTIDMNCPDGAHIPIELRDGDEIKNLWFEKPMALPEVKCFNPSFDVTDHELLTGIVTEKGICYPPFNESLAALFKDKK